MLKASTKYDFAGRQAIRTLAGGVTIHSVFDCQGNRIAEYRAGSENALGERFPCEGGHRRADPRICLDGRRTFGRHRRRRHNLHPRRPHRTASVRHQHRRHQDLDRKLPPFGGVRTTTGTPITARFPGQWFQSESGLHQNWMRDYDPTTGRYLQADPLGLVDGASIYGYVKQNPGRWTDPTGEIIPVILVVVVLAALLTPDAANAPGYCDGIVPLTPFAPYINGLIAAVTVAPFTAGFQPAWGKHVNSRRYNPRFSASKYCSRNWSINLSKKSPCKWL